MIDLFNRVKSAVRRKKHAGMHRRKGWNTVIEALSRKRAHKTKPLKKGLFKRGNEKYNPWGVGHHEICYPTSRWGNFFALQETFSMIVWSYIQQRLFEAYRAFRQWAPLRWRKIYLSRKFGVHHERSLPAGRTHISQSPYVRPHKRAMHEDQRSEKLWSVQNRLR